MSQSRIKSVANNANGIQRLWKPRTLEFEEPSDEEAFISMTYPSWMIQDLVGHMIGTLVGPVFMFSMWDTLPFWFLCVWLFVSLVYAPAYVIKISHDRQTIQKGSFNVFLGAFMKSIMYG